MLPRQSYRPVQRGTPSHSQATQAASTPPFPGLGEAEPIDLDAEELILEDDEHSFDSSLDGHQQSTQPFSALDVNNSALLHQNLSAKATKMPTNRRKKTKTTKSPAKNTRQKRTTTTRSGTALGNGSLARQQAAELHHTRSIARQQSQEEEDGDWVVDEEMMEDEEEELEPPAKRRATAVNPAPPPDNAAPHLDNAIDNFDQVGAIIAALPARERAILEAAHFEKDEQIQDLQAEADRNAARAHAQPGVKNKETIKAIDTVVKTHLFRTCKFITEQDDLDRATDFVLGKIGIADGWSAQRKANWNRTYRGVVGKCLCDRRNYAQSQLKDAAFGLHQGNDVLKHAGLQPAPAADGGGDENEEPDDDAANGEGLPIPEELFTVEILLKCATR